MLKSKARENSVRIDILEKDYALSYLLAAFAKTPGLAGQVILKGGTALRKLYYPGYRFSEDLDYSTIRPGFSKLQVQAELLALRGPRKQKD